MTSVDMVKRVKKPCLYIPEELVTEILVRLPVKRLLNLRSVCKSWRDFIRSIMMKSRTDYMVVSKADLEYFSNAVLQFYSRDKDGGLIPMAVPADFPVFDHRHLKICGLCNGIICMVGSADADYREHDGWHHDDSAFYLCNPATRELRRIPKSPLALEKPAGDLHGFIAQGFGFDPRTNEYKVVSVSDYESHICRDRRKYDKATGDCYEMEIYELRSNRWRNVETVLPKDISSLRGIGLLFSGCLHWSNAYEVKAFNVSDEVVRYIPRPPDDDFDDIARFELYINYEHFEKLAVVEDCLALLQVGPRKQENPHLGFVCVWVMTEYGVQESWSRRYSVTVQKPVPCYLEPVISWKDDILLINYNTEWELQQLLSCNIAARDDYQFQKVDVYAEWETAVIIRDVSLVSLQPET